MYFVIYDVTKVLLLPMGKFPKIFTGLFGANLIFISLYVYIRVQPHFGIDYFHLKTY